MENILLVTTDGQQISWSEIYKNLEGQEMILTKSAATGFSEFSASKQMYEILDGNLRLSCVKRSTPLKMQSKSDLPQWLQRIIHRKGK